MTLDEFLSGFGKPRRDVSPVIWSYTWKQRSMKRSGAGCGTHGRPRRRIGARGCKSGFADGRCRHAHGQVPGQGEGDESGRTGVETPNITAVIQLASTLMGRDYLAKAPRTMETLGLSGYSADELGQLLG